MNGIDLVTTLILLYAVYSGMRSGAINQALSILGIIIGLFLGARFGGVAAVAFNITGIYGYPLGFVVVFILTVIATKAIATTLRKMLHIVGLGIVDSALGIALSLAKYLLFLSVIFTVFNIINDYAEIVPIQELAKSTLFAPIANIVSEWLAPTLGWEMQSVMHSIHY